MVKYKQSEVPDEKIGLSEWEAVEAELLETQTGNLGQASEALWQRHQLQKRYANRHLLGRGRYGKVVMAQDRGTGLRVALKQVNKSSLSLNSTEEEYSILTGLSHRNLIKALAIFRNAPQIDEDTLVLEMVRGMPILEYLCYMETVNGVTLKNLVQQLLYALQYLHSRDIAHRDIKPENMLVEALETEVLKLIDFGSACTQENNHLVSQCPFDIEFSSPELITSESPSTSSDLWSTGVFIYVCLSGVSPFLDDSEEETLSNIMNCDYSFPKEYFQNIPGTACDLIASLLIHDPSSRAEPHSLLLSPWLNHDEATTDVPIGRLLSFTRRRRSTSFRDALRPL